MKHELIPDVDAKKLSVDLPDFFQLRNDFLELTRTEEWCQHVNNSDYTGSWAVLPLRGLAIHQSAHPLLQAFQISDPDPDKYTNYSVTHQIKGFEALFQQLNCGILSVRLMKLGPGSEIKEHCDQGVSFAHGQPRLHLCLSSDEQVTFTVAGHKISMNEGEFWYINADRSHSVRNDSDKERVHLVVDTVSNDWLQNLIGLPSSIQVAELDSEQRKDWLATIGLSLVNSESQSHHQIRNKLVMLISGLAELAGVQHYLSSPTNDQYTQTEHGKAISPVSAARCAFEHLRSSRFSRGIYLAITDLLSSREKIDILYAGTGPFATLLLPLLPLLDSRRINLTLVDIHQQSIDTLQNVLSLMGLNEWKYQLICDDACSWRPEKHYDLIISETMKAALADECQVSIFKNLVPFLKPDGILIPEKISLSASLVEAGTQATSYLGEISVLSRGTSEALANGHHEPMNKTFLLPSSVPVQSVVIDTDIQVYQSIQLTENECTLNAPVTLYRKSSEPVNAITLKYRYGKRPGYQLIE